MPDRHLKIADIAEAFGISRETLRHWERQGKIPATRRTPGGHRIWDEQQIEAIIKIVGSPRYKPYPRSRRGITSRYSGAYATAAPGARPRTTPPKAGGSAICGP